MKLVKGFLFTGLVILCGCAHVLPQAGPSTSTILEQSREEDFLTLVRLDVATISRIKNRNSALLESDLTFFWGRKYQPVIGSGDVIEVIIYEQPPAVLFAGLSNLQNSGGVAGFSVPAQVVDDEGFISVPFVGRIKVKGEKPESVASNIELLLRRKANNPQVVVRILDHRSANVKVLGHVKEPKTIPLSYHVSTLMDVLSLAGGPTSPIGKTLVRIDRDGRRIEFPLEIVTKNPDYNIYLQPGDVITLLYKTQSATFLGASGKNEELEFEAMGINLSQALGRVAGLQDDRAHAKGLFVFRLESVDTIESIGIKPKAITKDGKVPVVYNIDMSDPNSFFVIKEFDLKDKDIVFVATAPAVQINKFLRMLSDIISPIFQIRVLTR